MKKVQTLFLLVLVFAAGCDGADTPPRAVGQLESERIELTADVSEKLVERFVQEGSPINVGDALFRQDTRLARAHVQQAEAQVAERKSALDELLEGTRIEQLQAARAEVSGASKEKAFRNSELKRIQGLIERELASDEDLDRAQVASDSARAALDAASARLRELTKGPREKTIEQAAARLQLAEASLTAQEVLLDRHQALAPVDGILDRYLFEVGEQPAKGQVVAVLLSGGQPYARVYIPADIRSGIRAGDTATVSVDGIEGALQGKVRWVSNEAAYTPFFALTKHDRQRLSYLAKIDLDSTDRRLPEGVPVDVEF